MDATGYSCLVAALFILCSPCGGVAETVEGKSEELTTLMQNRRDTLRLRFTLIKDMHSRGFRGYRLVFRAENDLLNAELDMEETLTKRIALHKRLVENMKKLEQAYLADMKVGMADENEHLAVQAQRLEAEIRLVKERLRAE